MKKQQSALAVLIRACCIVAMRKTGMCCRQRPMHAGFTLIELLVVLASISLLASVAMSRYVALSDAAHRAGVKGVGAAYGSGVVLAHAQWLVNGGSGAVVDVEGFGAGNVDVSADGWPVDTAGGTGGAMTTARCMRLWNALLLGSAPEVAAAPGPGVQYVVSVPAPRRCRYAYQQDAGGRQIEYDAASGVVTTFSPPASKEGWLSWPWRQDA
jgi:prepilin-type N-terminal cleavage/methylation domain-containing protein